MLPTRIVLGGASRAYRDHVVSCIRRDAPSVEVVGQAPSAAGAAYLARRSRANLVILFEDSASGAEAVLAQTFRRPLVVVVPRRPIDAPDLPELVVLPRSRYTVEGIARQIVRMAVTGVPQRVATSRGSGKRTSSSTTRTSSTVAGP